MDKLDKDACDVLVEHPPIPPSQKPMDILDLDNKIYEFILNKSKNITFIDQTDNITSYYQYYIDNNILQVGHEDDSNILFTFNPSNINKFDTHTLVMDCRLYSHLFGFITKWIYEGKLTLKGDVLGKELGLFLMPKSKNFFELPGFTPTNLVYISSLLFMEQKHKNIFQEILGCNQGQWIIYNSHLPPNKLTEQEFLDSKFIGLSQTRGLIYQSGKEFVNDFKEIWNSMKLKINSYNGSDNYLIPLYGLASIFIKTTSYKLTGITYDETNTKIITTSL